MGENCRSGLPGPLFGATSVPALSGHAEARMPGFKPSFLRHLAPIMPDPRRALCPVRRGVITGIRPYARYQPYFRNAKWRRFLTLDASWAPLPRASAHAHGLETRTKLSVHGRTAAPREQKLAVGGGPLGELRRLTV
eukprot:COSAG02_NODE_86_length_39084_cov_17.815724_7_plen_137_part_00